MTALVAGLFERRDVAEGAPGCRLGVGAPASIAQLVDLVRKMRSDFLS